MCDQYVVVHLAYTQRTSCLPMIGGCLQHLIVPCIFEPCAPLHLRLVLALRKQPVEPALEQIERSAARSVGKAPQVPGLGK